MGFRFRKSIKVGPMRVNISKSGVGYSVGTKGYRVTKKANGGIRTTTSIPGTGVSYVKDYPDKKPKKTAPSSNQVPANAASSDTSLKGYCPKCYRMLDPSTGHCPNCGKPSGTKKPLYARWWFIVIACIIGLRACGAISGANSPKENPITVEPTSIYETAAPRDQVEKATAPDRAEETTRPTERINFYDFASGIGVSTDKEALSSFVLNTSTHKFHKSTCPYAKNIAEKNREDITGTRTDITDEGYEPCEYCDP